MHTAEMASMLGRVEHFRDTPSRELEDIILMGRLMRYEAGATVFSEGEPSPGMFVLISGRVELRKLSCQGQLAILDVIEPVAMFNEIAAFDRGPCPDTAVAVQPSEAWRVDPEALERILVRHPRIGVGFIRVMARRTRTLIGQFEDLSFRPVLARCAKLVLELSAGGARPVDRREHTNVRLAARVATVPEALCRSLRLLKEAGALAMTPVLLTVLDAALLANVAETGDLL